MFDFVEEIICFLIISSLITQLAPDESYKKSLKFFVGLMLLINVLSAVIGIFSFEIKEATLFTGEGIWNNSSIDFEQIYKNHYEEDMTYEESE